MLGQVTWKTTPMNYMIYQSIKMIVNSSSTCIGDKKKFEH